MSKPSQFQTPDDFWALVEKTKTCWNWTGRTLNGRGLVYWQGRQLNVHRLAWILHHGKLKTEDWVRQRCGNGMCVRPSHLYVAHGCSMIRTPKDFWKLLVKQSDGCWVWPKAKHNSDGYGSYRYQGEGWQTHRLAWTLANGPIPKGLKVLHHCDNPPCCNPKHLFLGTDYDNQQDRKAKGRGDYTKGEQVSLAKMTAKKVVAARKEYDGKYGSVSRMARKYGLGVAAMHSILRGRTWKHVH